MYVCVGYDRNIITVHLHTLTPTNRCKLKATVCKLIIKGLLVVVADALVRYMYVCMGHGFEDIASSDV